MEKISMTPPKGTTDWLPEEFAVRKYIFDTWRKVCRSYGYQEYLTPIIEPAALYRAKSGEDVGGQELTTFFDRAERELAIRPEMTPSVTRMVAREYRHFPKPIRLFSIANFFRNEKPQRGRNREFWQLNFDIFGAETLTGDLEVLRVALDITLAFSPPPGSFALFVNHRLLIEAMLEKAQVSREQQPQVVRILDKWQKMSRSELEQALARLEVSEDGFRTINAFMEARDLEELLTAMPELIDNSGYQDIRELITALERAGYGEWVIFQPNIIRGFDYYDGMVFEVFDRHPDNQRALFGGGRYNGLASIFGVESFPAVGSAPGDETLRLFLESWNLLPDIQEIIMPTYYLPRLLDVLPQEFFTLAKRLRERGSVLEGLKQETVTEALREGDRRGVQFVALFGQEEISRGVFLLKNLETGAEEEISL